MGAALDALRDEKRAVMEQLKTLQRREKGIAAAIAVLLETNGKVVHAVPEAKANGKQRRIQAMGRRNGMASSIMEAMQALSVDRAVPVSPKGVARWLKKHGKQSESSALTNPLSARVGTAMAGLCAKGRLARVSVGMYDLKGAGQ